jgi:SAM-dependent methyltransferase
MDLTTFRRLLTGPGQEALQAAEALQPEESDFLSHYTALSKRYPAELARAALETAINRLNAAGKFPFASQMYFTREAIEQASSYEVSSYRAQRYLSFDCVADLGCSVGGDTLALARAAQRQVIGLDLDELRLGMAQANLASIGLTERASFVRADLAGHLPFSGGQSLGLFFDPARREEGRRLFSVRRYHPPLEIITYWLAGQPALGVKISPGVDLEEISRYPAEIEFISLLGELKEAVLWFGPLKTAWRRATVLPGPHSLSVDAPEGDEIQKPGPGLPISEPGPYLVEPDSSILRAGLVAKLGTQLNARQLDASIAYLTVDSPVATPFGRAWPVEDWMPFGLKRLREYLRRRDVGRVVIKKRGSPLEPENLVRKLRLRGENERVLFLTQLRGKPIVVIGMRAGE